MQVGLGQGEFRAGLLELLVQVGRFNLSQQLSGLNMRADVGDPVFKIAIGSRKNGGFQPGSDFGRQPETVSGFFRQGRDDRHRGDQQLTCIGIRRLSLTQSRNEAKRERAHQNYRDT